MIAPIKPVQIEFSTMSKMPSRFAPLYGNYATAPDETDLDVKLPMAAPWA